MMDNGKIINFMVKENNLIKILNIFKNGMGKILINYKIVGRCMKVNLNMDKEMEMDK